MSGSIGASPPLVSIITACHNAEPFVSETIYSILKQTYPSIEHVVVDDESSDDSVEVIRSLVKAWPDRVRIVELAENRGGCYARNRGAREARGAYFMFLDADDLLAPNAVSALVQALEDEKSGLAVCEWECLQQGSSGDWVGASSNVPLPSRDPDQALRAWLDGTAWCPPCSVLWRRDAYEATGGWDETLQLNQDGDITMRALAAATRLARVASVGGFYRAGGTVSQSFLSEAKLRSLICVVDKISSVLQTQGRRAEFTETLGTAYQQVALRGFQSGHRALARDAYRRGKTLAGRRIVSRKALGRILEFTVGLELKEWLLRHLAGLGILTAARRQIAGIEHEPRGRPESEDRRSRGNATGR